MAGLYCLLGIIVWVVLYPYIRCFIKRLQCYFKVKRFCKKRNFQLEKTHRFWFLGRKSDRACDLYIVTKNNIYAVKLFAMLHRHSMLIFREDGTYFIRRFVNVMWIINSWNSKLKPLLNYGFRHKYKDEWRKKMPHNILLVNPVSMDIFRQAMNGYEEAVGLGDEICGMKIYALSRFLSSLEE